jgi:hypothetical protein
MSYSVIRGDLTPDMPLTLTTNDTPDDLTAASSIELRWLKPDGTLTTVTLTAVDLATGQVKRVWVTGDTDLVGTHYGQVVVTIPTSLPKTYPNDGSEIIWNVYPQLGDTCD